MTPPEDDGTGSHPTSERADRPSADRGAFSALNGRITCAYCDECETFHAVLPGVRFAGYGIGGDGPTPEDAIIAALGTALDILRDLTANVKVVSGIPSTAVKETNA